LTSYLKLTKALTIGHDRQKKIVRPDIYFTLGILGAIQHLAGIEESEFIIEINKDKEALIFNISDLGIVEDISKIIPLITEEIKLLKI
jgi:electron transfer flavoprotein alpha subunit